MAQKEEPKNTEITSLSDTSGATNVDKNSTSYNYYGKALLKGMKSMMFRGSKAKKEQK